MDTNLIRSRAPSAIEQAMRRWSIQSMQWGADDCMLAIADIVRQIAGQDPARRFRDRYRTRRGAVRVLGRGGVLKAARDSACALHWRRIESDSAQPGDVGLTLLAVTDVSGRVSPTHAAMICRAPGWFVGRSERGVVALPASLITHAWSIAR